jgi:hypothetical protein
MIGLRLTGEREYSGAESQACRLGLQSFGRRDQILKTKKNWLEIEIGMKWFPHIGARNVLFQFLEIHMRLPHSWPRFVNIGFGAQVAILFLVHLPIVDIFPARAALSTRKSVLFVKRLTMVHLIQFLEAFYLFQMTSILFPTQCYICFKARWCILSRVVWN